MRQLDKIGQREVVSILSILKIYLWPYLERALFVLLFFRLPTSDFAVSLRQGQHLDINELIILKRNYQRLFMFSCGYVFKICLDVLDVIHETLLILNPSRCFSQGEFSPPDISGVGLSLYTKMSQSICVVLMEALIAQVCWDMFGWCMQMKCYYWPPGCLTVW